jgi:5-methylcytosine-specific restriction protein A
MTIEEQLHEELLSLYRRTGEATGYWPSYFLRSVRQEGGLAVAKRLLAPGRVSSGFDKLVAARRADLSIEAIALTPPFDGLFSPKERAEAKKRLDQLPPSAFPEVTDRPREIPEEVEPNAHYIEGSIQRVLVNRYERNLTARAACTAFHGFVCSVCGFDFQIRYGELGRDFIHVHHKRPLGRLKKSYRVDPKKDLVPVCPNCHAMLHRREPPLDIEQLKRRLRHGGGEDTKSALS